MLSRHPFIIVSAPSSERLPPSSGTVELQANNISLHLRMHICDAETPPHILWYRHAEDNDNIKTCCSVDSSKVTIASKTSFDSLDQQIRDQISGQVEKAAKAKTLRIGILRSYVILGNRPSTGVSGDAIQRFPITEKYWHDTKYKPLNQEIMGTRIDVLVPVIPDGVVEPEKDAVFNPRPQMSNWRKSRVFSTLFSRIAR